MLADSNETISLDSGQHYETFCKGFSSPSALGECALSLLPSTIPSGKGSGYRTLKRNLRNVISLERLNQQGRSSVFWEAELNGYIFLTQFFHS